MSKVKLKAIAGKLKKASKAHANQAKQIDNMIKNKKTPLTKGVRKGGIKKNKSQTPGPIVAFSLQQKPGTSKNIGPQESPKEIARKKNLAAELTKGPSGTVFDAPKKDFDRDRKEMKDYEKAQSFVKMKNKNVASAMKMKTSPALVKLSASCKAAAKRKFKVYPSAYANMWAAKTQRQGKC